MWGHDEQRALQTSKDKKQFMLADIEETYLTPY